eukprot:5557196-Prymnesium_polylepis.1
MAFAPHQRGPPVRRHRPGRGVSGRAAPGSGNVWSTPTNCRRCRTQSKCVAVCRADRLVHVATLFRQGNSARRPTTRDTACSIQAAQGP